MKKPKLKLPDGRTGEDFDAALRAFVVKLLAERGISETQLGARIGLSQQNLNRFMRGGGTTLKTLSRLCAWTGKDAGTVLGSGRAMDSVGMRAALGTWARLAAHEGRFEVAEWLLAAAGGTQPDGKHEP